MNAGARAAWDGEWNEVTSAESRRQSMGVRGQEGMLGSRYALRGGNSPLRLPREKRKGEVIVTTHADENRSKDCGLTDNPKTHRGVRPDRVMTYTLTGDREEGKGDEVAMGTRGTHQRDRTTG